MEIKFAPEIMVKNTKTLKHKKLKEKNDLWDLLTIWL